MKSATALVLLALVGLASADIGGRRGLTSRNCGEIGWRCCSGKKKCLLPAFTTCAKDDGVLKCLKCGAVGEICCDNGKCNDGLACVPKGSSNKCAPVPVGSAPVPSGPAPVPSGPAPVPSGPAPVPSGPAPVPSGPAPVPSGPAPVPSGPAPVPSGPAPVPSGPAPVPSPPTPVPAPVPSGPAPVPAPVPSGPAPVPAPVPSPPTPVPAPVPSPPTPVPAPVPSPPTPVPTPVPSPPTPVPAPVPSGPAPVPTPVPSGPAPVPTPVPSGPAPVPTPVPSTPAPSIPGPAPSGISGLPVTGVPALAPGLPTFPNLPGIVKGVGTANLQGGGSTSNGNVGVTGVTGTFSSKLPGLATGAAVGGVDVNGSGPSVGVGTVDTGAVTDLFNGNQNIAEGKGQTTFSGDGSQVVGGSSLVSNSQAGANFASNFGSGKSDIFSKDGGAEATLQLSSKAVDP